MKSNDNMGLSQNSYKKNIDNKLNLISNLILALIFIVFVPTAEWPDSISHFEKSFNGAIYPTNIFENYLLYFETLNVNKNFLFFNNDLMYFDKNIIHYNNLERLPIVFGLIAILHCLFKNSLIPLSFNPPLIFSISAPSVEVFSIFLLLIALVYKDNYKLSFLLVLLSVYIDRSMFPATVALLIFIITENKLRFKDFAINMLIFFFLVFGFFFKIQDFINLIPNEFIILGINLDDIKYNSAYGQNKYLALMASSFGLFGWMSIRIEPYIIYYPLILLIFLHGLRFISGKILYLFKLNLFIVMMVLFFLPSLSQARYYPILTIIIWFVIQNNLERIKYLPYRTIITLFIVLGIFFSHFKFYII